MAPSHHMSEQQAYAKHLLCAGHCEECRGDSDLASEFQELIMEGRGEGGRTR